MKVLVLDLDGTIVHQDTWFELMKGALGIVLTPFLFKNGYFFAGSVAAYLAISSYTRVKVFPAVTTLVEKAKSKNIKVYVNTYRPWPFLSVNVYKCLGIPPSHYFFRSPISLRHYFSESARSVGYSKICNMEKIMKHSNCDKKDIVMVDDASKVRTALILMNYSVFYAPEGINLENVDEILKL